jgi:signal peptidase I
MVAKPKLFYSVGIRKHSLTMKEIEPAHRRQTSPLQMHSYFPLEMLAPRHVKKEKAALFVAPSWDQQVVLWLIIAALSLASYGLISHFLITTVQVSGRSMLPALHDGERYILNRLSFVYRDPMPGEIVVIRDPGHSDLAVKRIVAGPSDTVCIKNGCVHVNGKRLKESYLAPGTLTLMPNARPCEVQLGNDQYFVLGDNRSGSEDSRYYGAIKKAQIIGPILK